jgi:hypothetical protein
MMSEICSWTIQGDTLVAPFPSQAASEIESYRAYLRAWPAHPGAFALDDWQVGLDQARLRLRESSGFQSAQNLSLSVFEKLGALRQAMDLRREGIKLSLHPTQAWFHRAGYARWLPTPPNWFFRPIEEDVAVLLAAWFAQDIESLPWEWRAFWQAWQARPERDWNAALSLALYQTWPYATANRLGLKDGCLSPEYAQWLAQFGSLLGLSEKNRQSLDILAQQDQSEPAFSALLALLPAGQ